MSEPATIPERTQRFHEAVRDFKLPSPSRHAKLMPLKDGIVELRQKGASLRLASSITRKAQTFNVFLMPTAAAFDFSDR